MKLDLNLEDATWLAHFLRDLAESRSSVLAYSSSEMARLRDLIARAEAVRESEKNRDPAGGRVLRLVKSHE